MSSTVLSTVAPGPPKRLLIVSAWYYPFIHPRAHRWTVLAEHWAAQGHEVHVVCARRRGCSNESEMNGVWVHRVGFDSLKEVAYYWLRTAKGRGRVGAGVQRPTWISRLLGGLYKLIWKKIYFPDDACIWYFPARKKLFQITRERAFDALITVSLPFTGHLLGLALKQRYPDLEWLCDIGDPFAARAFSPNNALLFGALNRRLEHTVLQAADTVAVTNSAAKRRYLQQFGIPAGRITVIPPLLHPTAVEGPRTPYFKRDSQSDEIAIHLGYFGSFYRPVRTPDALLDLLDKTISRRPDLKKRLHIHIFGDVFPEFYLKLKARASIQMYGLRSREEVRAAMEQMDILINIGNMTDFQLPSKAVEYLASGKPVLHLSFVENDPFVEFWGASPGLFQLKAHSGGVEAKAVRAWIAFLESDWNIFAGNGSHRRIRAFTAEAVAHAYFRLIFGGPVLQSIPELAVKPAHR